MYFFAESTNYTFVDEQAIFANNELGMRHIEVYGFDYDYTLASYSNTLHYLIYDLAVKELISTYGVRTVYTTRQHKKCNYQHSEVCKWHLVPWVIWVQYSSARFREGAWEKAEFMEGRKAIKARKTTPPPSLSLMSGSATVFIPVGRKIFILDSCFHSNYIILFVVFYVLSIQEGLKEWSMIQILP